MKPWEASLARGDRRAGALVTLGWVFLHIGAVAFGGLGAALALWSVNWSPSGSGSLLPR